MKVDLSKSNEECLETLQELKLSVKVVYTSMTEKSLIMSGSTGLVHWRVLELVSLVVQRIDVASHLATSKWLDSLPGIERLLHK